MLNNDLKQSLIVTKFFTKKLFTGRKSKNLLKNGFFYPIRYLKLNRTPYMISTSNFRFLIILFFHENFMIKDIVRLRREVRSEHLLVKLALR